MNPSSELMITRPKIILPSRPDTLLTRERLLDLLYDLLDHRLIIIGAPAGYGKTALLVDMAHRIELPVCWYSLDPQDQGIHRFVTHFVASIAQQFPSFEPTIEGVLPLLTTSDLDLDRLIQVIVNGIYDHVSEHFVLILDDYHLINDSDLVGCFVSQFIQTVDESCHLILTSRRLVSLPDLPLMVARSQVAGFGPEELAFRPEEIQALVLQNQRLVMPTSVAEDIVKETEGWITGLLLSSQTMWQGMVDRIRLARISGVDLYEYLAQQVLDQQTAPVQEFMLRTSLLEEFNAQLCQSVLGAGDWQLLIDAVLQNNLFVLPVDDEGVWLRYHHLFRDFLQSQLAQRWPDEQDRILRRMVTVYADRQEWERAYAACQRVGDTDLMVQLVERAGPPFVKSRRWRTLVEWLDRLPPRELASQPRLLSRRGIAAVVLGEAERGLSLLDQSVEISRKAEDYAQMTATLVWRATAHRYLGNYQASLADTDEALTLSLGEEDLKTYRAEALKVKGTTLGRMGKHSEAVEWLEQALEAYTMLNDRHCMAMVLMDLGMFYMSTGHYQHALTYYTRARNNWQQLENTFQQANLLNNLGVLHHLQGAYQKAAALLEEGLEYARQSGQARIEATALASIGDLYMDLDALDVAMEVYQQAAKIARRTNNKFLLIYLNLGKAAVLRSKGVLAQAHDLLDTAEELVQESGSGFERGLLQFEAGRLALAEEDAARAIDLLREAARHFEEGDQRAEEARASLYLALAYQTSQDREAALTYLERAFRLASELESAHILVVPGREAQELLQTVEDDPVLGFWASPLLRRIEQFEQEITILRRQLRRQAVTAPYAPPKLVFQTLGRGRVIVGDQEVTSTDWEARVARDLLFYLLAHPEGATKEVIGSTFWPEHSSSRLKIHFKKTVYRLRRALDQEEDVVLFEQGYYRFNRRLDFEYDVDAFREKLARAQAASSPDEKRMHYRAALDLYRGPYLPNVDGMWVVADREQLWQEYLEGAMALARLYLEAGEYSATLDCCQRVLKRDRCVEEAHRLTMQAHAAMGDRAAVIRQFEHCRQALQEELDVLPAPQTQELYQKLTR